MSKKGEVNIQKVLSQMDVLLPEELKEPGKATFNDCKDTCKLFKIYYFLLFIIINRII